MLKLSMLFSAVVSLWASGAYASPVGIPAVWDFESPVSSNAWSTTTETEYFYDDLVNPGFQSSHLLGPMSAAPLDFFAMDLFLFATPYYFSFDLISLSGPLNAFSVSAHGQTIVSAGDLSAAEIIGFSISGSPIYRFTSLYTAGATPQEPLGCCGDVVIQWSLPTGAEWGIDNFVISNVPEPGSAVLLGLGLLGLSGRGMSGGRSSRRFRTLRSGARVAPVLRIPQR